MIYRKCNFYFSIGFMCSAFSTSIFIRADILVPVHNQCGFLFSFASPYIILIMSVFWLSCSEAIGKNVTVFYNVIILIIIKIGDIGICYFSRLLIKVLTN